MLSIMILMGYTIKAISGFSWQTFYKFSSTVLGLLKIFILARILSPNDFGLFSLTAIALGLTESFTQTGVNITIIQSKNSINYFLNTAWVISIVRGLIIGIIMTIIGIIVGNLFENQLLITLIAVSAFTPVIKGFINPAIIALQKDFLFFKDSVYRFSLILIESLLAIFFALIFKSVWALVFAIIGSAIFEVIISFIFFKDKPIFQYIPSRAKVIFCNAKWLGSASLLHYLDANLDDLILGKIVGTHNLGLYHNSYALSHRVNFDLSKSVQHGAIPIYAKIADDNSRLNRAFKKTFLITLLISVLASLPIFIFPELSIKIILGDKWLEATNLVRPLLLAGIIQASCNSIYSYFLTKNNFALINLHLALGLLLMVIFISFFGNLYGLIGGVMGILISRIIAFPLLILGLKKNWKNIK
jgi:lipopolysaccharide exporter